MQKEKEVAERVRYVESVWEGENKLLYFFPFILCWPGAFVRLGD